MCIRYEERTLCSFTCYVLYMHSCVSDMKKEHVFVHLLRTLHACMCIRYEERTIVAMEVPILLVVRFLTQHWNATRGMTHLSREKFLRTTEKSVFGLRLNFSKHHLVIIFYYMRE